MDCLLQHSENVDEMRHFLVKYKTPIAFSAVILQSSVYRNLRNSLKLFYSAPSMQTEIRLVVFHRKTVYTSDDCKITTGAENAIGVLHFAKMYLILKTY